MTKPTLKKHLVQSIATVPLFEGCEQNRVILLTAAGMIMGDIITEDDISNSAESNDYALSSILSTLYKQYREENEIAPNSFLPGNDGCIMLKNVTLHSTTSDRVTTLPQLSVFFDQIIGITLGTSDSKI